MDFSFQITVQRYNQRGYFCVNPWHRILQKDRSFLKGDLVRNLDSPSWLHFARVTYNMTASINFTCALSMWWDCLTVNVIVKFWIWFPAFGALVPSDDLTLLFGDLSFSVSFPMGSVCFFQLWAMLRVISLAKIHSSHKSWNYLNISVL